MSVDSKQLIERLKQGEKAYWGFMGPYIETNKAYSSAREFDINLRSAKSLLNKGTIKIQIDEWGMNEIILIH